jgi:hypothetical protein
MTSQSFQPSTPLQTAVLFLVFNRPQITAQVFEAIRKAKPPRLYVAADGARTDREGEYEKVLKVREIATAVDWPCELRTLFRDKNLGCKLGVSGGIDWFFQHEEQGIILEDDCLPSQSFFWFCEELLGKYANDPRIYHIDGCNFVGQRIPFDGDYDFSRYALIWGWATWRRAWKLYDPNLSSLQDIKRKGLLYSYFGSRSAEIYWLNNLRKAKLGLDTWDYQWFAVIWSGNGLVIGPSKNMIKNIGFGVDATHTLSAPGSFDDMLCNEYNLPLIFNGSISAHFRRDLICSRIRFGIGIGIFGKIIRRLRAHLC